MDWFIFDPTVNVEGIATAAAALGAATVYIVDLIVRRLRERKGRKRGARGRMILELVQSRFADGVSEAEVYRYLQSDDPECIALRKRYKIKRDKDTHRSRQDIETHLIQLVFDRLIEIDSPDHFRLWGSSRYLDEMERQARRTELARRQAERKEVQEIMHSELVAQLWAGLDTATSKWEVTDTLDELSRLGESITAEELRRISASAKDGDRLEVDRAIARFLRGGDD